MACKPLSWIANLCCFMLLLLFLLIIGGYELARMVWLNLRAIALPYILDFCPPVAARAFSRKRKNTAEDSLFHVLLVADDATTLCFHTNFLNKHSCKVSIVPNGMEALRFLGLYGDPGSIPDLIVADYDMPSMNGYILLQLIKEAPATRDLRVVVLLPDEMLHRSDVFRSAGGIVFKKPLTDENVATLMNGRNRGNALKPTFL